MMNIRRILYRVITYMEDRVGKCRQVKHKVRKSFQLGASMDFLAVSPLCDRYNMMCKMVYI